MRYGFIEIFFTYYKVVQQFKKIKCTTQTLRNIFDYFMSKEILYISGVCNQRDRNL